MPSAGSVEIKGNLGARTEAAIRELPVVTRRITMAVTEKMRDEIADRTPIRKVVSPEHLEPPGLLKRSWRATYPKKTPDGWEASVETDVPYAEYVEYDTAPHTIRPHPPKRYLRFWSKGRWVYARSVEHPGTTGYHMVLRGTAATEAFIRLIGEHELRLWARLNGFT